MDGTMKKAFTLVELLVVIAILALLTGLLFPVFVSAKKRAKEVTTISNLRQCSMVLLTYCDDHDGIRSMPTYEVAKSLLKNAPTCDSLEHWRTGCKQDWGEPLIGSYGYVRGVPGFVTKDDDWLSYVEKMSENPPLLLSPWHGQFQLIQSHGDGVPWPCNPIETCRFPDRMGFTRADGSTKITSNSYAGNAKGGYLFTWSSAFSVGR